MASSFVIIVTSLLFLNLAHFAGQGLQCENEELQKCQQMLKKKDGQIQDLTTKLIQLMVQKKSGNTSIDSQLIALRTCNDVDKRWHLRWQNQCIHRCHEPHACSVGILSCFPYNNCIIECHGPHSCSNLRIDFLSGGAKLKCEGFNSCKDITMNAVQTYKYENIPKQTLHKAYKPQYEPEFNWFLPKFQFKHDHIMEFTQDQISVNKHYILAKNVVTESMVRKIQKSHKRCLDTKRANHSEHREFGTFNHKYEVTGHEVTFMDDCLEKSVYTFMKSVTIGMLKYVREYTLERMKTLNISSTDQHKLMEYISDNWVYDWQELIGLANDLESRVIEYILYSDNGNLGWHTDDESNLTLAAVLNDESSFDGGVSMFSINSEDKEQCHVKLGRSDIILFPSMANHAVSGVQNGERHVLVFEWWNIGRSRSVGRVVPSEHLKELKRKKANRKRKKRQHWSQLF